MNAYCMNSVKEIVLLPRSNDTVPHLIKYLTAKKNDSLSHLRITQMDESTNVTEVAVNSWKNISVLLKYTKCWITFLNLMVYP